ncbi:MAG: hypothetical protein ACXIU8_00150 [Alkalilacustris sp.]
MLLVNTEDVERQSTLSARLGLPRHEVGAILKALRRLGGCTKKSGEVVATPGEVVRKEKNQEFERDRATDDPRVKTAVSRPEDLRLRTREETRVNAFRS